MTNTDLEVAIGHEISKIFNLQIDKSTGRTKKPLAEGFGTKTIQGIGAVILRVVEEQTERLK